MTDFPSMALVRELLCSATRAPSGHNTQPWHFRVEPGRILVFADFSRRLPVVDPDDHALYISLGCAIENLVLAASASGWKARVSPFPESGDGDCAVVELDRAEGPANGNLAGAIAERQTTRARFDGRPIPAPVLGTIVEAGTGTGVRPHLVEPGRDLDELAQITARAAEIQYRDRAFRRELASWIRFSERRARDAGDGLCSGALGVPSLPDWLGRLIVTRLLRPVAEAGRAAELVRSSSAALIFFADTDEPSAWLETGRCFERMALTATSQGVRHAHMNMPCEVREMRGALVELAGRSGQVPLLNVRLGYAEPMPRSYRRALDDVLEV